MGGGLRYRGEMYNLFPALSFNDVNNHGLAGYCERHCDLITVQEGGHLSIKAEGFVGLGVEGHEKSVHLRRAYRKPESI